MLPMVNVLCCFLKDAFRQEWDLAPLIFIPGIAVAVSPWLNGGSSHSKMWERKQLIYFFACFRIPLTFQAFRTVAHLRGLCFLTCSGTLSPRSGQSCPETDGTAQYKFSIPAWQHCWVCQAPFSNPAGETLCLLFYKFRVCFKFPHPPPFPPISLFTLSHIPFFLIRDGAQMVKRFFEIFAFY